MLGASPSPAEATLPGALRLETTGHNKIEVIKAIREHTGLGLKDAKELCERAPCVVAEWSDPARLQRFREALARAGARVR
jgi:large subunit ribosomal protein L7/L12